MYLYISPTDFTGKQYPNNTQYDFIYELPHPVSLEGDWGCAIVEVLLKRKLSENLYVFCDIVDNSIVHGESVPLLRTIENKVEYLNPFYHKITLNKIKRLRISIRTKRNSIPVVNLSACTLVLEIKQHINSAT